MQHRSLVLKHRQQKFNLTTFLHLMKASDTIDHKTQVENLSRNGMRDIAGRWIMIR